MPGTLFDLIQSIKKGCVRTEEKIRADHGLSASELAALRILEPNEFVLGGEFAGRMDLSASRGSRVINQMVQKRLLQVKPLSGNRRSIHVSLTETGERLQSDIETEIYACEEKLLSRLPETQRKPFRDMLEILCELLNTNAS